ncbi:hypothetical protein [Izhakiella australiensis]|nr:hypothetical protein [Izhakiella australiensis]
MQQNIDVNITLKVINIMYNPVSYSDPSWLLQLTGNLTGRGPLPDAAINYLLIKHYCPVIVSPQVTEIAPGGQLLICHWHRLQEIAWLLGLKCCATSLIRSPLFLQQLTDSQRRFFFSPFCLPSVITQPALADEQILEVGAQILFQAANQLLSEDYLSRLRLVFPQHCNCNLSFDGRPLHLVLAAIQQAVLYV